MNSTNKTEDELLKELKELQQKYDSLKEISDKDFTERKRVEKELTFQASMLDQVHNGVIALDKDNKITFWNKFAEELYQWKKEETLGKNIVELLSPEEMKSDVYKNIKTIRKEGHWEGEFNVKRKDGSTIPAFIINTILRSLDGKDIGILGVSTDITERKKAEQELIKSKEQALESEERFDLAMKATKDGLYDWNLTNNEINYSPSWKHMLGYENDELSNDLSTWEKLINPQDVKRVSLLNKKVMDKQLSNVEIEFKMKHKDGHWVDILSRAEAFYNDVGEANRIVGTHIDITERKLAEEKHRTILETAINGFWVVNMQGEFVEVNDAYCHMSGYSIDELLTMSISDIECIESPTDINNRINDILKNGSDHFETKHRRKGGSVYDVEINIQYKQFDEGQFVCFINDITERKQAEEKLKAKIGQLEMMNDIMVDRELNLNETRKEVNKLLAKLGEDEKYKTIG